MEIDWLTVSAQIVNFLILVYLLKRFLYQPVLRAMDGRERRISARLDEAARREQEAEGEADTLRARQAELERKKAGLMDEAREQAEAERRHLLEEARAEIEDRRRQWRQEVDTEREAFLKELRDRAAEGVLGVARRVLTELADTRLEQQTLQVFLRRLEGLEPQAREAMAASGEPLRLATAFELDTGARERLNAAVRSQIAPQAEIQYRQAPELGWGLELSAGGQRLSWNLSDYLDDLARNVDSALGKTRGGQ
jgi:F-type H+-transporting ATPase subunit b